MRRSLVTIRIGDIEEQLTWEQWEQRVREGRIPESALVQFEPVTGDSFELANKLDIYHSLRTDASRAWSDQYRAGPPPWMTALIAGVQIRLWWLIFTSGRDLEPLVDVLVLSHSRVFEDGEIWRLLSMGILHLTPLHILANLAMLVYVGWNLERALGRVNLAVIFFGSVIGGSLLSLAAKPGVVSIGASGGVLGVVAAATVFGFVRHNLLPDRARIVFGWALFPYLALVYLSGWTNETTDNWAHTGGLIAGALLAIVLDPPGLERRRGWSILAPVGVAALALVALIGTYLIGAQAIPLSDTAAAARSASRSSRLVYRELEWSAPASWYRGSAHSTPGFVSRGSKQRLWSVRQREMATYATLPERIERLREDLIATFGDSITFIDQGEAELGGHPAYRLVGQTAGERPLHIDARVAVRGLQSLEAIWIVEGHLARRLAGLHQRSLDSVVWKEPIRLVEARSEVSRRPRSRAMRRQLAEALSAAGADTEARELWETLIREQPELPDGWVGLLGHEARVESYETVPHATWVRALASSDTPAVHAEVALSMFAHDLEAEAVGLLELGWIRAPGDRALRRARRAMGLPVELDDVTPAHLLRHPRTGAPLNAPRRSAAEITIDNAREVGEAVLEEREALVQDIIEAGDPSALGALVLLQLGLLPSPEDLGLTVTSAVEELDLASRGVAVRRIPASLTQWAQQRLDADPDWLSELSSAAESLVEGDATPALVGLTTAQGPQGPTLVRAVDPAPPAP